MPWCRNLNGKKHFNDSEFLDCLVGTLSKHFKSQRTLIHLNDHRENQPGERLSKNKAPDSRSRGGEKVATRGWVHSNITVPMWQSPKHPSSCPYLQEHTPCNTQLCRKLPLQSTLPTGKYTVQAWWRTGPMIASFTPSLIPALYLVWYYTGAFWVASISVQYDK